MADLEFGESGLEAAKGISNRYQGRDAARLRAYFDAGPPVQERLRARLADAQQHAGAGRHDKVVAILAPLELGRKTILEARILRLLVYSQRESRKLGEALATARRWHAVAAELGWLDGQAEALTDELGLLQLGLRYDEMADANGMLADVERQRGRLKEMHTARIDQAGLLIEVGRLKEAWAVLPAALEESVRQDWKQLQAIARDNLAMALWKQGDYASALHEVEQARALWQGVPRVDGRLANALLKGSIQQEIGDFDSARATFLEMQQQLARTPDRWFRAATNGNLGVVAWRFGQYDRAIAMLEQARAEFARLGDAGSVAMADKDLGEALIDAGRPKAALDRLDGALEGFGNHPLARAEVWTLRADALLRKGRLDDAVKAIESARAIAGSEDDRRTRNRLFEIEARVRLARGDPGQAVALLRRAMDLVEGAIAGLSDEQTFRARAQRARLFDVAVESAFVSGRAAFILEFLERSRAAVLRDAIGNRRALYRAQLSAELAGRLRAAERAAAEARLRYLHALKQGPYERIAGTRKVLDGAERELREIADEAQRSHKRLEKLQPKRPVTLPALRKLLKSDETLVYYAIQGARARAFVVGGKGQRVVPLGESAPIRTLCGKARAAFASKDEPVPVDALRKALVAPLGLDEGARVMVCAEGPLAFVPWPLLLGTRYASNMPSGTTLALLRGRSGKRGRGVLAFGDPHYAAVAKAGAVRSGLRLVRLPFAGLEVQEITAGKERKRVYVEKRATEAELRAELGAGDRWRALHFACHGFVDEVFPRRSGLALTPSGNDDGLLTIPEIVELDVAADMVVLSACDSGRGRYVRGEGVIGLARAFLVAGAPCVVASLWKVDDAATRELMVEFYRQRAAGAAAAGALRAAQRKVERTRQHPRDWAAWVIWGLPDP